MRWYVTYVMFFLMGCVSSNLWGWEGDGTVASPYLIQSRTDLEQLTEFINSDNITANLHFKMTQDIDLTAVDSPNSLIQWRTTGELCPALFNGTFDGDSHIIYNLNKASIEPAILTVFFTYIGDDGVVENLGFENVNILSGPRFDELTLAPSVFKFNAGTIRNCHVTGSFHSIEGREGDFAGLVYVNLENGVIEHCYSDVTIEYSRYPDHTIGGMVWQNDGIMRHCRSYGTIRPDSKDTSLTSFDGEIGGMVGINCGGQMIDCSSWVDIESILSGTGGLVGKSSGMVINCYAGGDINCVLESDEAESYFCHVGGLVGNMYGDGKMIVNSHTDGIMNINIIKGLSYSYVKIGGIAGEFWSDKIESSTSNRTIRFHAVNSLNTLCIGGVAGFFRGASIVNSGAAGSLQVTSEAMPWVFAGGLAGCMEGRIDSSFSQMDISLSGAPYILAGGLTGWSKSNICGSWVMNRMDVTHDPDTSRFTELVVKTKTKIVPETICSFLSVGGLVGMRLKYDNERLGEMITFSDCRVYGTVNIRSSATDRVLIDPIFCKKQDDLNVWMVNCQSLARFNRLPVSKEKTVISPLRKKTPIQKD